MSGTTIQVTRPMVDLFIHQLIGGTSGHMAEIPNSPVLKSIVECHGVNTYIMNDPQEKRKLADFFEQIAQELRTQADNYKDEMPY